MKKNIIITLLLVCTFGAATAQSTLKTAYFMDRMTTRHEFNPALQTEYGYFSFPLLGDVNFGINSNMSLDQFIFPLDNGELGLFANPAVDSNDFLNGLNEDNTFSQELGLSLISTGFYGFGGFNTFEIAVRQNMSMSLDKSLFEFMVGSNDSGSYSMGGTTMGMTAWTEIAFGHSRKVIENLTVGIKFKYLVGLANVNFEIEQMDFSTSSEQLDFDMSVDGDVAVIGMPLSGSMSDLAFDSFDLSGGMNGGFAVDFGATYEWDDFTFSLAMTDLGSISWATASTTSAAASLNFSGFTDLDINDFGTSTEDQMDELTDSFSELEDMTFTPVDNYSTSLNAKLNLGVEYEVFPDKLSAGLLWFNTFGAAKSSELMLVGTYSPSSWFDIALSGTTSTYGTYWGWAINVCPRWINFFVGMDTMIKGVTPQYIPYNSSSVNLKFGLSFPFGGTVRQVN